MSGGYETSNLQKKGCMTFLSLSDITGLRCFADCQVMMFCKSYFFQFYLKLRYFGSVNVRSRVQYFLKIL